MGPERAARLGGVIAVLAMPFRSDGAIDHDALEREAIYLLKAGVDGLAMGFGSEATYLTDRERDAALRTIVDATTGRRPVVASVVVASTMAALERVAAAEDIGADVVMVTPPAGPGRAVLDFFRSVDSATSCEVIVQDAPAATGITLDDELLVELCSLGRIVALKVETVDAYARMARLRARGSLEAALLGGNGGLQLMSELRSGSDGTMPGAGNAADFVRILGEWKVGRHAEAEALFAALQPLLVLASATPDAFLYVQKELLRREGVLEVTSLRATRAEPDPRLREEIDHLVGAIRPTVRPSKASAR